MNLHVGQQASRTLEVTPGTVRLYADVTGDRNPLHFDEAWTARTRFQRLMGREEVLIVNDADGQYILDLKAGNGHVIASSEPFPAYSHAARAWAASISAVATYLEHWDSLTGARFEVFEGTDGRFYFRLYGKNGAQVLRSQGYSDEANALNGAFLVADYGVSPAAYKIIQSSTGFYFNGHTTLNPNAAIRGQLTRTQ